ncbi:hypothetical protein [uncultured Campylobacter sp.]|nr:hypothetical protein [uncultured Campylobacter sp.]
MSRLVNEAVRLRRSEIYSFSRAEWQNGRRLSNDKFYLLCPAAAV